MTNRERHTEFGHIEGAVVTGDVRLKDGNFIGRDQVNNYYNRYVTHVFPPRVVKREEFEYPYVGDRPYWAEDSRLLTGRRDEIGNVKKRLEDRERQTAVVYGKADVGKTSFISAGVLPLLDDGGAEVIALRDYRHATPLLRALLHGRAVNLGAAVADEAASPDLARAILGATPGRLVLVLDQFERLYWGDVSAEDRKDLREELRSLLDAVERRRLRIVIAIRHAWLDVLQKEWGNLEPGLGDSPEPLLPLGREEAAQAIFDPLYIAESQLAWHSDFVRKELVPHLDTLSPAEAGYVLPGDLQIVCKRLHALAMDNLERDREAKSIDGKLYSRLTDGGGAEWLLDRHFKGLWDQIDDRRRELAEAIAREMLVRDQPGGIQAGELHIEDASLADKTAILEEMARVGLLAWQLVAHDEGDEPRYAYTFASESTARAAERSLGREVRKRLQAHEELGYVWQDWKVDRKLAGDYQLNLLEDHYRDGPLKTEKALLLLRSAVECGRPVAHWLGELDTEATRKTLEELEKAENGAGGDEQQAVRSQEDWLLGLKDVKMPSKPKPDGFGPLAWAAVAHPTLECRETCTLALMTAHGEEALTRVEEAVDKAKFDRRRRSPRKNYVNRGRLPVPEGWRRRWHLAELRGILSDASRELLTAREEEAARSKDEQAGGRRPTRRQPPREIPRIEEKVRGEPPLERMEVWWWRVRRRMGRDAGYIGRVSLGGAVGAGLALAALRFVQAVLLTRGDAGRYFYSSFPLGFLLGGALSLGLLLVNVLRLRPPEHLRWARRGPAVKEPAAPPAEEPGAGAEPPEQEPESPPVRPFVRTLLLGSFAFALVHVLLNILFGFGIRVLRSEPQIVALALLAGAGLTLAVWDLPLVNWRPGARPWLWRLAAVAVVFALVQGAFVLVETQLDDPCGSEVGLLFSWPSSVYRTYVPGRLESWGLRDLAMRLSDAANRSEGCGHWHHYLAIVDSAIVGLALAVGLMVGLVRGGKSYLKTVELERQASD
jgi:hypothetical protein